MACSDGSNVPLLCFDGLVLQGIELYKDNLALCERLNAYYAAMQNLPALRCACCSGMCLRQSHSVGVFAALCCILLHCVCNMHVLHSSFSRATPGGVMAGRHIMQYPCMQGCLRMQH
jgi:hypothetical protein